MNITSTWLTNRLDDLPQPASEGASDDYVGAVLLSRMPDLSELSVRQHWETRLRGLKSIVQNIHWQVASEWVNGEAYPARDTWALTKYFVSTAGGKKLLNPVDNFEFGQRPSFLTWDEDDPHYTGSIPVIGAAFYYYGWIDGVTFPVLGAVMLDEPMIFVPSDLNPPSISCQNLFSWIN